MPAARTVLVPDRGEFFVRDTGETDPTRPVVLLLHGWMVSADLNWWAAYGPLTEAGYRVIAPDHRGHARGLRAMEPFRLTDCADDAAAILRTLGISSAVVVGYSMGGTIAQLMVRDHRELVTGAVYSGTCQHFQDAETVKLWRYMGVLGFGVKLAPRAFFKAGFKRSGISLNENTAWWMSEMLRHSGRDVAEAGRELGRFDSRPWLAGLAVPSATVLTARDTAVSPAKQRELAAASRATQVLEVGLDHLDLTTHADVYNPALISAVRAVTEAGVTVAA
jgi:pimeloyl-ACP methyl ester carboxylesterase